MQLLRLHTTVDHRSHYAPLTVYGQTNLSQAYLAELFWSLSSTVLNGCRQHRMAGASDQEKLVQDYRQLNKSAFVLGYTGGVGKELVKALLESHVFAKVVLIGRRTVTYEDELYKDVVSV